MVRIELFEARKRKMGQRRYRWCDDALLRNQASLPIMRHIDFSAGVGTQGTLQGSMNARSQSDNVGISAYASYIRTGGDNVSRVGNEDDGYDNMTNSININYAATSEHTLIANFTVQYENDYDSTDFVTTGLPADSDNVTDGSQVSAKLRWEFAPENTGYRSALSAHYRKDETITLSQVQTLAVPLVSA